MNIETPSVIVDPPVSTAGQSLVNSLADIAVPDFSGVYGQNNGNPYEPTISTPATLLESADYGILTLNRTGITYAYKTFSMAQKVVDAPVDDAFRGGIEIKIPEISDAEDMAELYEAMEMGNDLETAKLVMKWDRLFGGAGLIVNTDQDPSTPLNPARLNNGRLGFIAADRWELILSGLMTAGPGYDSLGVTQLELARDQYGYASLGRYNYYGVPLDDTRVCKVAGREAPSLIRPRLQGWGISVLEGCLREINTYIKFQNLLFELADEAKIDVYGIEQFNEQLATAQGTALIKLRIGLANWIKNYKNALVMDKEDTYEQKQIAFSGLADIMEQFRVSLCAATGIPYNKLFGASATGFGSGEDAMENYSALIDTEVRAKANPLLRAIVGLRCHQVFGFRPKFTIEWKPLRVLTGVEEEQVKTSKQARVMALRAADQITGKEADEILHKENLLTIETEVGQGLREPEPGGDAAVAAAEAQPKDDPKSKKKENAISWLRARVDGLSGKARGR